MKTRKPKKITHRLELVEDDNIYMAVGLAYGSAGKKVKKEWSMSSAGTDLLVHVGDVQYHADLMPLLRQVLAAGGVR